MFLRFVKFPALISMAYKYIYPFQCALREKTEDGTTLQEGVYCK